MLDLTQIRIREFRKVTLIYNLIIKNDIHRRSSNKYYYKLQPGTKGTLLPDSYRRAFARKQITCIEYQDISEDEERDIFQVNIVFFSSRFNF